MTYTVKGQFFFFSFFKLGRRQSIKLLCPLALSMWEAHTFSITCKKKSTYFFNSFIFFFFLKICSSHMLKEPMTILYIELEELLVTSHSATQVGLNVDQVQ
jgi:hypothetical protein